MVFLKNSKDHVYKKFDFSKYPKHVEYLKNFAWKILIWAEVLPVYGGIVWFDSSIWFWNGTDTESIRDKIFGKNLQNLKYSTNSKSDSCFLYYIKQATHNIASHTHPNLYSYFPGFGQNLEHLNENIKMKMAGAVIIYNEPECQNNILKWAILCALTEDCIHPKESRKQCPPMNSYLYNQSEYVKERDEVPYRPRLRLGRLKSGTHLLSKPFWICHRFDQSLFSILVHNYYNFEEPRIYLDNKDQIAKPYRTGEFAVIEGLGTQSNYSAIEMLNAISEIERKMGIDNTKVNYERQRKIAINKIVVKQAARPDMRF